MVASFSVFTHLFIRRSRYAETKNVPGAMREWMKGQADAALATDTPVMWCEQTQASVCLLLLASGLWLLAVAVAVASTSASFKVFLNVSYARVGRCMERGSEMVQAVEFPAVTTARASGDYHPPSSNWFLGCGNNLV